MKEHYADTFGAEVESKCLVCQAAVMVPALLKNTAVLCQTCKLPRFPGAVIKYLINTEIEQRAIREQGREACIVNWEASKRDKEMPLRNPYEFRSESWSLWKEGYLEELNKKQVSES